MITLFRRLFRNGPDVKYASLVANGALIVDVRSAGEYQDGHIKGSLNIPLETLRRNLAVLSKDRTIITCCASGMRSATASNILKEHGFTNVYNGGGWISLQNKMR